MLKKSLNNLPVLNTWEERMQKGPKPTTGRLPEGQGVMMGPPFIFYSQSSFNIWVFNNQHVFVCYLYAAF